MAKIDYEREEWRAECESRDDETRATLRGITFEIAKRDGFWHVISSHGHAIEADDKAQAARMLTAAKRDAFLFLSENGFL